MHICTLIKENKSLVEKLKIARKDVPLDACENGINNANEDHASNVDSSNNSYTNPSNEDGIDLFNRTYKAGILGGVVFFLTNQYMCTVLVNEENRVKYWSTTCNLYPNEWCKNAFN